MWKDVKRIMKPNALIVFFCTAKFGYTLIHSNPKWFKYDLIWKKSRKVGFLSANRCPLRQHELIYVFKDKQGTYHPQKTEGKPNIGIIEDKDLGEIDGGYYRGENGKPFKRMPPSKDGTRHPTSIIDHENIYLFNGNNEDNEEIKKYSKKVLNFIGLSKNQINKKLGHRKAEHFFYYKKDVDQFSFPTRETYKELIDIFKIDEMNEFINYDDLQITYNPQKTEGKEYKSKERTEGEGVYIKDSYKRTATQDTKHRHPTSIIDHENIYVFDNTITDDIELSRNKDLREYAEKVFKFIGKTKKQIIKKIGQKIDHFSRFKSSQFGLATKETYDELIKEYNIDEMEEYLEYDILEGLWEEPTYNPQKTEGTPYKKNKKSCNKNNVYNIGTIGNGPENKGDRHPTSIINEIPEYEGDSILVYKNPHKTIHRTQKPVELLEWLIKTYSNEGDTVMDFCMGSGTCGIACMNTKRKFIGAEMDEEIFNLSLERFKKNIE